MATDPRQTFRDYITDGLPSSGRREPPKAEVRNLMLEIFLHPAGYRADIDDPTDDAPSVQLCAEDAATLGWMVRMPDVVALESPCVLPDKAHLVGNGCVITGSVNGFFTCAALSRVTMKGLNIQKTIGSTTFIFDQCDQVILEDCVILPPLDGDWGSFGFRFKACDFIHIKGCDLYDHIWPVYLGPKDGAAPQPKCGTCIVEKSWFEQLNPGNGTAANSYPGGIYQYECNDLSVDDCDFVNFYPGDGATLPGPSGYGVYEGDADVALNGPNRRTHITNSRFRINRSDAAITGQFTAVYASSVRFFQLVDSYGEAEHTNSFNHYFCRTASAAVSATDQVISRNHVTRLAILAAESGDHVNIAIVENKMYNVQDANAAIRVGANGATADSAVVRGNMIRRAIGGGIAFFGAGLDWIDASDNIVKDVNEANTAYGGGVEHRACGIFASGPTQGRFARNHVANIVGSGHAKYGLAAIAAGHDIDFAADNNFYAMETAPMLNST